MKAIVTHGYGPPEVLALEEVERPAIRGKEVLVRVHACSVNPVDWKIRQGEAKVVTGRKPPRVLGGDYAGTVFAVGDGAAGWAAGDAVWGMVNAFKGGTYAEYLRVKPEEIDRKPARLSMEEAASLPLVGLTVLQSLLRVGRARAGDHVMVNGCSGGVGIAGIQIAKALGCTVTGTCSARNRALAERLGADEVIDYTSQDPLAGLETYDVFFDAVGNYSFSTAKKTLKPGGRYVTTLPSLRTLVDAPLISLFSSKKFKYILARPCARDLASLRAMVEGGQLVPVIEKVYPLEQVREAHARSESGRVVGKLVLTVP